MNVLSVFDGMSCGRIALERAGIEVDNYFASEIDKYAIQIAKKNYPDTKHIGSVVDVKASDLPKIDLLIGGSPCQGFSFAGKQLNFEDERSKLFFEYVRLLEECKPKYFLLENVKMKKEYQDVITSYLRVEPILINSSLVSAQNRERLYWTNIPNISQPDDKGVLLRDILDCSVEDVLSEAEFNYMCRSESTTKFVPRLNRAKSIDEKSNTLTQSLHKGVPHGVIKRPCEPREFNENSILHHAANAIDINGNECIKRVYADSGKAPTLTTMQGGHREPKVLLNKICNVNPSGKGMNGNVYGIDAKCPTLTTNKGEGIKITVVPGDYNSFTYRKLTPKECERLQTVPDNYTEGVSNSQRYKMLGNGWTISVISHIFSHLPKNVI